MGKKKGKKKDKKVVIRQEYLDYLERAARVASNIGNEGLSVTKYSLKEFDALAKLENKVDSVSEDFGVLVELAIEDYKRKKDKEPRVAGVG